MSGHDKHHHSHHSDSKLHHKHEIRDKQSSTSTAIDHDRESRRTPTEAVPPGLERFVTLDKIIVKQELELLEVFCNCEGKNRYSIKDDRGREFMHAKETTCCCWLRCCCCNKTRPFKFTIDDFDGHEIYLNRNLACNTCFCPLCLNKVKVTMKDGGTLGYVKQRWGLCCKTNFYIKNGDGKNVLKINGPCCTSSCLCSDVNFEITNMEDNKVGNISKKWGGIIKEAFTDADSFCVVFPMDLDVKIKAVLMAAAILIDFMFFEDNEKTKHSKT